MKLTGYSKIHAAVLAAFALAASVPAQSASSSERVSPAAGSAESVAANEQLVRRFLSAVSTADAGGMRAMLAPTARLTLVVAGVYLPELHAFPQGTQWNRDGAIAMEVDLVRKLRAGFAFNVISMTGEGPWVATEVIGDGVRAETGRRYLQHYSLHLRMGGGRILEIRMYEDTLHDWDVWQNSGPAVTNPDAPAQAGPAGAAPPPESGTTSAAPGDPEANKEVVRHFLMSVPLRSSALAEEAWAPDGIMCSATDGEYLPSERIFRGAHHWIRDAMIRMQQKAQSALREPLTLDVYSLVAEGDRVSAEAIGILVRPSGVAYRQHYSFHFTFRGGRIYEGHDYGDTLHGYDLGKKRDKYEPVAAPLEPAGA